MTRRPRGDPRHPHRPSPVPSPQSPRRGLSLLTAPVGAQAGAA